ncbi:cytochrome c biogenesis protein ResB [soil metagenome]
MAAKDSSRRPGELGFIEMLRWMWRQLTSMRTALILLLLLALGAIPGSLIPQSEIDSLKATNWKQAHPDLTTWFDRFGLFDIYSSPWFGAIYLLLMISLIGCILPRLAVYWRSLRSAPVATPRNLLRLPDSASYTTDLPPEEVLARAGRLLRRERVRVEADSVSADRGRLREAGNLVFHISVVLVLVGFAAGMLFGYKGGVILVQGNGFTNTLSQYDEIRPGSLFDPDSMDNFHLRVDDFELSWLTDGPGAGMARKFEAHVSYENPTGSSARGYNLRVNHPLSIGATDVFLIGHGYAPVITVRDAGGNVVQSGPVIFLPLDESFRSTGVVKAPAAEPEQIGLDGEFYPNVAYDPHTNSYYSSFGDAFAERADPMISMLVYTGDLGLDDGAAQSVYSLDTTNARMLMKDDGSAPLRLDLRPGESIDLPDGLGSVSLEGIERWQRLQISSTPGRTLALGGVIAALIGLMGSLFIRPRRTWVRAQQGEGGTLVHVAALDRSGGGDTAEVVEQLVAALRARPSQEENR